jgi:hypothetical protein
MNFIASLPSWQAGAALNGYHGNQNSGGYTLTGPTTAAS